MSDARDVMRETLMKARECRKACYEVRSCDCAQDVVKILAALAEAGRVPPMPTGRLHKALQDAFQSGVSIAFANPDELHFIEDKHRYCDAALKTLLEGSE